MTNNIYLKNAECGCKMSIEITGNELNPIGKVVIEEECEYHKQVKP